MPHRLKGVVDGVLAGDLNGWLVNLDAPAVKEAVICRSDAGAERTFRTFQLREDVCAALSTPGTFGFSIPLSSLADLGARLSVYDRNGEALAGGLGVTLGRLDSEHGARPGTGAARDNARLFLHIPKTAGTSLRSGLASLLRYSETLLVYPGSDVGISIEQLAAMPDYQKRQFKLVFGHFYFGLHRLLPVPSQYIAVLRQSRSRVRSNVMHHAAAGTTFMYGGKPCSPSFAINEGLEEEFDNVMTRSIAGVAKQQVPLGRMGSRELDMAMENIRRHFLFVGRYESLDADTATLCRLFGAPAMPLAMLNRTADRPVVYPEEEMQRIDWPGLFARNRIDELLYEAVERAGWFSRPLSPAASPALSR